MVLLMRINEVRHVKNIIDVYLILLASQIITNMSCFTPVLKGNDFGVFPLFTKLSLGLRIESKSKGSCDLTFVHFEILK